MGEKPKEASKQASEEAAAAEHTKLNCEQCGLMTWEQVVVIRHNNEQVGHGKCYGESLWMGVSYF